MPLTDEPAQTRPLNDEGALAGLRAGHVTVDARDLVIATARALARTGRYTTPAGARKWSYHDVRDLAADFLSSPDRLVGLATTATDGSHLKNLIQQGLRRLIIDRFRATPRGVLWKRIERRVHKRQDIENVAPKHWALGPYAGAAHWGGDPEVLVAAANGVPVDPPPSWSDDSPRLPPATTGRSIDAVCTTVLDTAAAPVDHPVVLTVVSDRVLPGDLAHVVDADTLPEPTAASGSAEDAVLDAADHQAAVEVADRTWALLNDDERALLPHLADPSRQVADADVLGLGKSAIDARQKKLRASLKSVLADVPDLPAVIGRLLELHQQWEAGQLQGGAP